MKTVPTRNNSTTENTRMMFFIIRPEVEPVSSEMLAPRLRMESMPLK
jgi:hypothetical protein